TGTYTTVSDEETAGASFGNNVLGRTFEVTTAPQMVYSTDGIDVYPAADLDLTSIGTNSFTGGEDGLVLASMYHIKAATEVSGMQIMLASGTVAGAEVYGSIKDTATFWADDMSSLYNAQVGTVTDQNITDGYMYVYFDAPITLSAGEYYAAIELYSNGNSTDIRVLDDRTVDQPYTTAAIYIPGDQSYSNGTALGIRLLMGNDWGAGIEENALEGVSIYPNPSQGIVNVSNNNNASNTIVVYDMLGQVVLTKEATSATTLDLSGNGTGVYLVEVSNNNGSMVERVVIK
ncbi:MAG: T9SS type A sorting domain-containing protein, partial [Crocinitomicaceae bacterium]|nr:T9SS type A sorting domain-containing protein [Crocinitomicaceae bacterium]